MSLSECVQRIGQNTAVKGSQCWVKLDWNIGLVFSLFLFLLQIYNKVECRNDGDVEGRGGSGGMDGVARTAPITILLFLTQFSSLHDSFILVELD